MKNRLVIVFLTFLLIGCSRGSISFLSQPEGAYITVGSQGIGTAPLKTPIVDNGKWTKDAAGCYLLPEVKAQWASGAVDSYKGGRMCDGLRGNYTVSLNRPSSAPGLDRDLAIANQNAVARAQQQQAQAQRDIAVLQMMGYMQQQEALQQQQQYMRQQQLQNNAPYYTNCQQYGNSVNCTTSR